MAILLNEQEKAKIVENTQKIYNWIKENICPFIREKIEIDYGAKYTNPRNFNVTTESHLYVYADLYDIFGNSDYISVSVRFGFESPLSKAISNARDLSIEEEMIPLVSNWKDIKFKLLEEKEKQILKYSCIDNFEV